MPWVKKETEHGNDTDVTIPSVLSGVGRATRESLYNNYRVLIKYVYMYIVHYIYCCTHKGLRHSPYPTPNNNKQPEYFFLETSTSGVDKLPPLRKLTVNEFRDVQTHAMEGQKWSRHFRRQTIKSNCGADGVQEHGR